MHLPVARGGGMLKERKKKEAESKREIKKDMNK
jgi:hypothetical protein